MPDIIEAHKDELTALCREFGVARLELFGSATTPEWDPTRSDLDFLVDYPPDYDFGPWMSRFFAFQQRLSSLFGRPVDLVMNHRFRNPYFARAVDQTRQLLYAA